APCGALAVAGVRTGGLRCTSGYFAKIMSIVTIWHETIFIKYAKFFANYFSYLTGQRDGNALPAHQALVGKHGIF
ncbi:MAG: hypothetical protein ACTS6O_13495, partial [Giesbergeria sp.]